ncbi:hypothetical protein ACET3Z_032166 [Daucus carota]
MELSISRSFQHSIFRTSLSPIASEYTYRACVYSFRSSRHRLKCNSKPLRVELSLEQNCSNYGVESVWDDCRFVEVIAIGSRRDAVLDFCLDSPLLGSALRLWDISLKDSVYVELQQRVLEKDIPPCILDTPSTLQSHSKAIILAAGAAYGSEYRVVLDILKTIDLDLNIKNSLSGLKLNAESSHCNTLNSTPSPQFSATALLHKAKLTGSTSNNGNFGIGNSIS